MIPGMHGTHMRAHARTPQGHAELGIRMEVQLTCRNYLPAEQTSLMRSVTRDCMRLRPS